MARRSDLAQKLVRRVEARHLAAFRGPLVEWFERNRRPMPWREPGPDGKRDPYRVWISEVMLQQTRVETVLPYFERFTKAFPTVEALAEAYQDEVLKKWEGLGYYSRARNLHRAAKAVVADHLGQFPEAETDARALPGVGPYTAAAVLSLAFGVPLAVLDGNVIRVLARVFAVEDDTRKPATRTALQEVANALLDHEHPGRFNEAVMEVGATVCTPRSPACAVCPLREVCAAHALGDPVAFPVVSKRKPVPHKEVAIGLVRDGNGRYLIQRRPENAMLGGLWEFPGGKVELGEAPRDACRRELAEELGITVEVGPEVARVDHAYSHFTVTLHAFRCEHVGGNPHHEADEPVRWVPPSEFEAYAFPRGNRKILDALAEAERQPGLF